MAIVNGTDAGEWLPGTPGDDTINGFGGSDSLWGDTGVNFLNAGDGDDNLVGAPGIDHMDGGNGFDIASYQFNNDFITVSLRDPSKNTGSARGDTYLNIEAITTSTGGGFYEAPDDGKKTQFQLWSLGGTTTLVGGDGYCVMISGSGADKMVGGSGRGLVDYEEAKAAVTASLTDPSINTGEAIGDTYSNLFDMAGSRFSDTLTGDNNSNNFLGGPGEGAGNDTFFGLGGNDTFQSGTGADTMTGGAGTDLIVSTGDDLASARAGQMDRITDFNRGNTGSYNALEADHIDLSRLSQISSPSVSGTPASSLVRLREDSSHTFSTLDIFVDNAWLPFIRLDNIHAGEAVKVILNSSQPNGVEIFAPFGNDLGSRGPDWRPAGVGDFDADGTSDILWQNTTTGALDDWRMVNGSWAASVDLGSRGPEWRVAGVGDFDHDGTSNILWQNVNTGAVDEWRMANSNWAGSVPLGSRGPDWLVAGVGDFNGDGTADILWRNRTTGQLDDWQMANGNWSRSVDLGTRTPDWQIAGIADLNGDGTDDILWRNPTTGQLDDWQMKNGNWSASVDLGLRTPDWQIVGLGDFTGDNTADIMWRHSSGQTDIWKIVNGNWAGSSSLGSQDPSFQPAGVGDFNHSGVDDMLWRDGTGHVIAWIL